MSPIFYVIAWCASQVIVNSTSTYYVQAPGPVCYDSEYQVYDSTKQLTDFFRSLNSNQKHSASMFAVQPLYATENFQLLYRDGTPYQ